VAGVVLRGTSTIRFSWFITPTRTARCSPVSVRPSSGWRKIPASSTASASARNTGSGRTNARSAPRDAEPGHRSRDERRPASAALDVHDVEHDARVREVLVGDAREEAPRAELPAVLEPPRGPGLRARGELEAREAPEGREDGLRERAVVAEVVAPDGVDEDVHGGAVEERADRGVRRVERTPREPHGRGPARQLLGVGEPRRPAISGTVAASNVFRRRVRANSTSASVA